MCLGFSEGFLQGLQVFIKSRTAVQASLRLSWALTLVGSPFPLATGDAARLLPSGQSRALSVPRIAVTRRCVCTLVARKNPAQKRAAAIHCLQLRALFISNKRR